MIQQTVTVLGHALHLGAFAAAAASITLPTGSEGVDYVYATFDTVWNDYATRKAQFWVDKSEIYETSFNNSGLAEIPEEVMLTPGVVHMAIKAEYSGAAHSQEGTVIATNEVLFTITQGAWNEANAPAPSPSLFEKAVQAATDEIIEDITPTVQAAEDAATAANTAASAANTAAQNAAASVGQPFSTHLAYNKGDYVQYNGLLYQFTADKSVGAWDASKVQRAYLTDAASSAEAAASNANTQARLANDAATLANTKAGLAGSAATAANSAADAANAAAALIGEGMDGIVVKDTTNSTDYLVQFRVVNGKPVMQYKVMEDNT